MSSIGILTAKRNKEYIDEPIYVSTLEDGILSIKFSHEIPEEAKPKILQIK